MASPSDPIGKPTAPDRILSDLIQHRSYIRKVSRGFIRSRQVKRRIVSFLLRPIFCHTGACGKHSRRIGECGLFFFFCRGNTFTQGEGWSCLMNGYTSTPSVDIAMTSLWHSIYCWLRGSACPQRYESRWSNPNRRGCPLVTIAKISAGAFLLSQIVDIRLIQSRIQPLFFPFYQISFSPVLLS